MKLHLPSRLRRAVLACLAPVLTLASSASWSAALLPSGALCLFAAAPQTRADDNMHYIEEAGDWFINGNTYGNGSDESGKSYWFTQNDDFCFNVYRDKSSPDPLATKLPEDYDPSAVEKNITLTLESPWVLDELYVAEGTHVRISTYGGEYQNPVNNTMLEYRQIHLDGVVEFVAVNDDNIVALNVGTSRGIHDVVDHGKKARIILNFRNRNSDVNGLDNVTSRNQQPGNNAGLARFVYPGSATEGYDGVYSGALELWGRTFGVGALGQNPESAGHNPSLWVVSTANYGAQLQIGALVNSRDGGSEPDYWANGVSRVYYGDVYLSGLTTTSNFNVGRIGSWDVSPRFGALRMVKNSTLYGTLYLKGDSNMLAFAPQWHNEQEICFLQGVEGVENGIRHRFTIAGHGIVQFGTEDGNGGKEGHLGVLMFSDAERTSIGYATNNFRLTTARDTGRIIVKEGYELEVSSLSTVERTSTTTRVPQVAGGGVLKIVEAYGNNDSIFSGNFGLDNDGNRTNLVLELLGKAAENLHTETKRFSQRMVGDNFNVNSLTIHGGILELETRAGFNGSMGSIGDNFVLKRINSLTMDEKPMGDEKENRVSELWVHGHCRVYVFERLDMSRGGRILIEGEASYDNDPGSEDVRRPELVIGYVGKSDGGHVTREGILGGREFNGIIEVGKYGLLVVQEEDERPTNGLNIVVSDESGGVWGYSYINPSSTENNHEMSFVMRKTEKGQDRLNLSGTKARFHVTMRDGGLLSNAENYVGIVTVEGGLEGETNTYYMGGFGMNGAGLMLGSDQTSQKGSRKLITDGGAVSRLEGLGGLKIMNEAELNFSKVESMWKGKGEPGNGAGEKEIFNFRDSASGELTFGTSGNLTGSLEFRFSEQLIGTDGSDMWYHVSNKSIESWKDRVQISFYDAVLRGVGLDFRRDGWLRATLGVTPENIYVSTRDNYNGGTSWGWNLGTNGELGDRGYEATIGARAVYVNKETRIDLSDATREDRQRREEYPPDPERDPYYNRGLVMPNLLGSSAGNLVITGKAEDPNKSLVTFSNRISQSDIDTIREETGVTVNKNFNYEGKISITNADLAIRHVKVNAEPNDLNPAESESATCLYGAQAEFNLTGGALLMQSGVLPFSLLFSLPVTVSVPLNVPVAVRLPPSNSTFPW